jgi:hypothetical protein
MPSLSPELADMAHQPVGVKQRNGNIKIAVSLKPELFERLRARAAHRHEKFSDTVNDVLGCGLLDLEEAGE